MSGQRARNHQNIRSPLEIQLSKLSMEKPIYLDYNATTPVDPRVVESMMPFFTEKFGNDASTQHAFGHDAAQAVDHARQQLATLFNADPREIICTSGATESNNLAIKGAGAWYQDKGKHIISAVHEHLAVVDPLQRLVEQGYEVTWLRPDPSGVISAEQVEDAIRNDTILVSIMWAHNEIGSINPIQDIGRVCKDRGVLFHTDAAQFAGRLPVDVHEAGIDLLSASAHKFYGPKGVGCLYVRRRGPRARLTALIDGGGHQRGLRSGTLNVPGIVGMGAAAEICINEMDQHATRLKVLRDDLEQQLSKKIDDIQINGRPHLDAQDTRMYQTSNVSFAGIDAQALIKAVPQLAISSGSACQSASGQSTRVLRSLGLDEPMARAAVRFSLGRATDQAQIDAAVALIADTVDQLRRSGQTAQCGI